MWIEREEAKLMETAVLLSQAGARKEVIVRTLIEKGADPKIAKKLANRAMRGKQRKRLLIYLLAIIMMLVVAYGLFWLVNSIWFVAFFILITTSLMTLLLFNGTGGKGNHGSGINYHNLDRKIRDDEY